MWNKIDELYTPVNTRTHAHPLSHYLLVTRLTNWWCCINNNIFFTVFFFFTYAFLLTQLEFEFDSIHVPSSAYNCYHSTHYATGNAYNRVLRWTCVFQFNITHSYSHPQSILFLFLFFVAIDQQRKSYWVWLQKHSTLPTLPIQKNIIHDNCVCLR